MADARDELEAWRDSVERFVAIETDADAEAWVQHAARWCHPEIEWDMTDFGGARDLPLVLYGIDAVRSFWRGWFASWTPQRREFELVDAGDSVVMLIEVETVRERATGRLLTIGPYAQRATFDNGLVTWWKAYTSQARALDAAFGA